jgi:hypothetical protein
MHRASRVLSLCSRQLPCHETRVKISADPSPGQNRAGGFSAPTGEIPQVPLSNRGEPVKTSAFSEISALSGWRSSCPCGWRASRVSSSSLFDRADAGSRAKRQLVVQGLVSRRHVDGLPASGVNDVPERARRRHLRQRGSRSGRVRPRGRSAHGPSARRPERSRCSSVPTCRPTN